MQIWSSMTKLINKRTITINSTSKHKFIGMNLCQLECGSFKIRCKWWEKKMPFTFKSSTDKDANWLAECESIDRSWAQLSSTERILQSKSIDKWSWSQTNTLAKFEFFKRKWTNLSHTKNLMRSKIDYIRFHSWITHYTKSTKLTEMRCSKAAAARQINK